MLLKGAINRNPNGDMHGKATMAYIYIYNDKVTANIAKGATK